MSRSFSFSAVVVLLCAAQAHALVNCEWNGYNLAPLAGADIPGGDSNYNFIVRMCGQASDAACAANNGSFCQYSKAGNTYQHVLSKWTATGSEWSQCTDQTNCPQGGVQVHYQNGDMCPGGVARQTTFIVACGSGTSTEYAVIEGQSCAYTVVFTHSAGCGNGASSSSGTVNPVASSTGTGPLPPIWGCSINVHQTTYDLSALAYAGDLTGSDNAYNYLLHFCSNVTESRCWSQGANFCQYNSATNQYVHAISKWETYDAVWSSCDDTVRCPNGGIEVSYANGDKCGNTPRNVTFQIACAAGGSNTAYTVEEQVGAPCAYTVRMSHAAGCPKAPTPPPDNGGGGGNGGKIAGAVIGVLLGVALIGGGVWYYKYRYLPRTSGDGFAQMSDSNANTSGAQTTYGV